jgi:hypothetical protein
VADAPDTAFAQADARLGRIQDDVVISERMIFTEFEFHQCILSIVISHPVIVFIFSRLLIKLLNHLIISLVNHFYCFKSLAG